MKKPISAIAAAAAAFAFQSAQESDIIIKLMSGERPAIAVPDLRGAGPASSMMGELNATLFRDLQESGVFRMVPKSLYPLEVPQRPQDLRPPLESKNRNQPPARQGPWLTDWSMPPVNANYLTMGYAAEQNGSLVLFGWLYNVNQPDAANAQAFGKLYFGAMNEEGARKVAHEFAADVLARFGQQSLAGTKIYFASDRTGHKEIWVMDWDGSNQRQITSLKSISGYPAVSPDGTRLAFTTYATATGQPEIYLMSLETGRRLTYYNQRASLNATPEFTPDGQRVLLASSAGSSSSQIMISSVNGSELRPLSSSRSIEVSPRVNPKTGAEIVFVSGRGGTAQIYKMNMDGADVVRLTSGEGEAHNPAWHPEGKHIAFAWTKGYDPGNLNIFIMDVATGKTVQLTHGAGRNENPVWAPDGRRLAFSSTRSGSSQIWTMLADGTSLRQLTSHGRNYTPVWSR
jgi:TolB protein